MDPCLVISDKVICLVYVDNTLFYSPKLNTSTKWFRSYVMNIWI
jgi:hypothetical protein